MQQTVCFTFVVTVFMVALAAAELTFDAKICSDASTSQADCVKCCKDKGFNDFYTSKWTPWTTSTSYMCQCGKDIPKLTDKRKYFRESKVDSKVCNYGYNMRNSESCTECCTKEGFNHGTMDGGKIPKCSCSFRTWLRYSDIEKRLEAGEKFGYVVA